MKNHFTFKLYNQFSKYFQKSIHNFQSPTTNFLITSTIIFSLEDGITADAGTVYLSLYCFFFTFFKYQSSKKIKIYIFYSFLFSISVSIILLLDNFRSCCYPWVYKLFLRLIHRCLANDHPYQSLFILASIQNTMIDWLENDTI